MELEQIRERAKRHGKDIFAIMPRDHVTFLFMDKQTFKIDFGKPLTIQELEKQLDEMDAKTRGRINQ